MLSFPTKIVTDILHQCYTLIYNLWFTSELKCPWLFISWGKSIKSFESNECFVYEMRERLAQILHMSSHTICCRLGVLKDTGSNSESGLISFKSSSSESEHWGYRSGMTGM